MINNHILHWKDLIYNSLCKYSSSISCSFTIAMLARMGILAFLESNKAKILTGVLCLNTFENVGPRY